MVQLATTEGAQLFDFTGDFFRGAWYSIIGLGAPTRSPAESRYRPKFKS